MSLVGPDIYRKLIKGYTEKQWGRECTELPASIIRRLPVRMTFDNNYFNDAYQGIPVEGYTKLVERMLEGIEVELGIDYLKDREVLNASAERVLFTGPIDAFFDYELGHLEYRSLRFEDELKATDNYQGVAVMNFTDRETPYTRIIEHKHFVHGTQPETIITREYPMTWTPGAEPYYPVNDARNSALYQKYQEKAAEQAKVLFGGRMGQYRYYDMDKAIESALSLAQSVL